MKKRIWMLIMMPLVLVISSLGQPQELPPLAQQICEKTQQAILYYKENNVIKGAALLCDVVLMVRPRTSWPDGFTEAVETAKGSFLKANFSNGVGSIKKAIIIFKPDYSRPSYDKTGQVANIAQLTLEKIKSALEKFKAGNADQAVLLILESLILLSP